MIKIASLQRQVILIKNFKKAQDDAANSTNKLVNSINNQIKALEKNARLLTGGKIEVMLTKPIDNTNKKLKQTNNELDKIKNKVPNLFSGLNLSNIFAGYYLITRMVSALKSVTNISDTALSTQARFGLYNESKYTNEQLYDMAYMASQRSRTAITDTTDLMNRILVSGAMTGPGAATQSLKIAEIINKASIAGGGTREEVQRSLRQLAQGISSGALQGDELRSIREQTPFIAQMLAEGLNKVAPELGGNLRIGDLKELGSQGEITADRILKAFEAMDSEITDKFNQMPRTFSQSMTQIENVWNKFIADLSKGNNALAKINKLAAKFADYLMSEKGQAVLSRIGSILNQLVDDVTGLLESTAKLIDFLLQNTPMIEASLFAIEVLIGTKLITSVSKLLYKNKELVAVMASVALATAAASLIFQAFGDSAEDANLKVSASWKAMGYGILGVLEWTINGILHLLMGAVGLILGVLELVGNLTASIVLSVVSGIAKIIAGVAGLIDKLLGTDYATGINNFANSLFGDSWKGTGNALDTLFGKENTGTLTDKFTQLQEDLFGKGFSEGLGTDGKTGGMMYWQGKTEDAFMNYIERQDNLKKNLSDIEDMLDKMSSEGFKYTADIDKINSPVEISSEDLKLLKDIASRDMLLNMMSVTPQANITFGDVRETADVNKIMDVIEDMVENAFATELVY